MISMKATTFLLAASLFCLASLAALPTSAAAGCTVPGSPVHVCYDTMAPNGCEVVVSGDVDASFCVDASDLVAKAIDAVEPLVPNPKEDALVCVNDIRVGQGRESCLLTLPAPARIESCEYGGARVVIADAVATQCFIW